MRGRVRLAAALILAASLSEVCGATKPSEYQVKAAFLYKFATYIRWPAADAKAPFVIAVIGKDPFGPALDFVVRDQTIQGRPIVVRRAAALSDAVHCDLLFVSAAERRNVQQILDALRRAPVLTVSDMDRFAESGGMIGLVTTEDNRIRFDVNRETLERAGLKAHAQLLKLARIVESRPAEGQR